MFAPPVLLQSQGVENTGQTAQEAGEAVEAVDTAGVVEPQPGVQQAREEEEAEGADQTSCQAQQYSQVGLQQDICYGPDTDSSWGFEIFLPPMIMIIIMIMIMIIIIIMIMKAR